MKNNRLIFLHLPKNAGTTMNRILKKEYDKNEIFTVKWNKDGSGTGNLSEFKKMTQYERDNIKFLSGHFNFGLHEYFTNPFQYVSMMRHPVERTVSFYNYVKRQKSHRLLSVVKDKSLIECIKEVKDFDVVNGQARKLSGTDDESLMLSKALENIENHFAFMGIQEYFEESILLFNHKLGFKIRYFNHSNSARNKPQIDSELINEIENLNQIDLELYRIIEERFLEELKSLNCISTQKMILKMINKMKPKYDKFITKYL